MASEVKTKTKTKAKKIKRTINFTRFVEIGRVCLINYGPYDGKICVIIDVVDQNRALVSGPENLTGVPRHAINFKRLVLTNIKINVGRGSHQKALTKAFTDQKVQEKWENSGLYKKQLSRARRASMNDFDRFKCMIAKKRRTKIIKEAERKIYYSLNRKGKEPKKSKFKQQGKAKGAKGTGGKKPAVGKEKPEQKPTEKATEKAPAKKPEQKPTEKAPAKKPEQKPTEKAPPKKPEQKPTEKATEKAPPKKPEQKPTEKGGKRGGKKQDE